MPLSATAGALVSELGQGKIPGPFSKTMSSYELPVPRWPCHVAAGTGHASEGTFFLLSGLHTGGLEAQAEKGAQDWFLSIDPATLLNLPSETGRGKEEGGRGKGK